jgi:hypothetical protein
MNIFLSTEIVKVQPGYVVLNSDQARRRNHVLVKVDVKIDEFDLSAAELKMLSPDGENDEFKVYKLIEVTNFKKGEVFGYDGYLNKALVQKLLGAAEAVEAIEQENSKQPEIADDLYQAIMLMDTTNAAHFSQSSGKPELKILKGLMSRKVKGKERDAAWKALCADVEEIVTGIGLLEKENDDHFDEEGNPVITAIESVIEKKVSVENLNAALDILKSE